MTRYEIAARHPDGRALLVGYSPRVSRSGLLAAMQKHGAAMCDRLSIGERDVLTWATQPRPHARTGEWWIGFTGRTQLDARASPLPFVGATPEPEPKQ